MILSPHAPCDLVTGSLASTPITTQQNSYYFTTVTGAATATATAIGQVKLGNQGDVGISFRGVLQANDYIPGTQELYPTGVAVASSKSAQTASSVTLVFQNKSSNYNLAKGSIPVILHDNYTVVDKSATHSHTHDANVVSLQEVVVVNPPTS